MAFDNIQDTMKYIKDEEVEFVDVRFTDVPGTEHHFSIPASMFDEDVVEEGLAFDGSSIRGFTTIEESDMILMPDLATAQIDPFRKAKTLNVKFFVNDPFTHEAFSRDPRNVARKAEEYLDSTGIADTCFFGAEAEFYLFDSVRYSSEPHRAFYEVDSIEGWWNRDREAELDGSPNLGYKTRMKGGYFPVPPYDKTLDVRDDMTLKLAEAGFEIERFHHEVGSGGQQEINYKFNTLLHAADDLQTFKYIIKNTAQQWGKTATFMPKPLANEAGSGMHAHQSLWKDGKPLFYDESGYGGLSDIARWYIGGILHHAGAVLAFTNPTLNSYHRLVPGFEAPINLAYSARNRSASIRIPYVSSPKGRRIEVRFPDPTCNPYLGFAAMLMAGLDGVQNKIHPGDPMDKNLYDLPPQEMVNVPTVAGSLREALIALQNDRAFLTRGDVFSDDQIDAYIELKWEEQLRWETTPSPVEYDMYYSN